MKEITILAIIIIILIISMLIEVGIFVYFAIQADTIDCNLFRCKLTTTITECYVNGIRINC